MECTRVRDCSSCTQIGVDVDECPDNLANLCCSCCGNNWQCNPDDDDDYYGHLPCGCCDCCGCSCDERDDSEEIE